MAIYNERLEYSVGVGRLKEGNGLTAKSLNRGGRTVYGPIE